MKSLIVILFTICAVPVFGQTAIVNGKVTDNVTKQPVVGAKVMYSPTLRAISDYDGNYVIKDVPFGEYDVVVTMLSFDSLVFRINVNNENFTHNIFLGGSQEIEEMKVIGNLAQDRKTPVAVSTIGKREITEELGSQDLPMILNSKPGIHATQLGGGDGDARITIRGFSQRNVGVMIDGVPVNDMENGWVYWSNWFGLDNITSQIQVQRGLGATKLAMPSVGGTINILTDNTGGKREIKVNQEYGTGNFLRTSLSYKSGTLKNGWGVLFSGSYKQGNGWADGLSTQGGFYYLKVQKKIKNHVLSLSGFGAPQKHGQRAYNQPIKYWDTGYGASIFEGEGDLYRHMTNYNQNNISSQEFYNGLGAFGLDSASVQKYYANFVDTTGGANQGIRYNQHWGYYTDSLTGKTVEKNERLNYYHKPQITLKDFWLVNKKLSWSNMAYVSIGRGGGQRSRNSGLQLDSLGQIDWNKIEFNNRYTMFGGTTFSTADSYYHPTEFKSSEVLTSSVNNHLWIGGLSQFDFQMNEKWKFSGGLDYRYYKGEHYVELRDLLGGDYWVNGADQNSSSVQDPTSMMKRVGDKVGWELYHNHREGFVQWAGGFAQGEYSYGRWTAFVNASGVANWYKGIDYFRKKELRTNDTTIYIGAADTVVYGGKTYTNDSEELVYNQTDWYSKTGFTFKAGTNFNVTERQNIFVNLGILSRTPQFSNVIDNNYNRFFEEILNENIMAAELGYGFRSKKISLNLNTYYTQWENRPLPFGKLVDDPNDPGEKISVNIPGMDALHIGAELDISYNITKSLTVEGMISYGDWTWQSAEDVILFAGTADADTINFDAKGVHVGDAAQSTYAASVRWAFVKNAYIKVKYTYFDRYFSNFDPMDLSGSTARKESWEIPSYGLMSIHMGYRLKFEKSALNFKGNIFNVLNTIYISDANNNGNLNAPKDFNANSASVFFGQGTTFNVSLGFEF